MYTETFIWTNEVVISTVTYGIETAYYLADGTPTPTGSKADDLTALSKFVNDDAVSWWNISQSEREQLAQGTAIARLIYQRF